MKNLDHPLIIIGQILIAFYLFRLFFALRRTAQPLPQIIGILAFGVLANVTARVAESNWFWVADILQYVGLAVVIVLSFRLVNHQNQVARMQPNAPVIVATFFDRIETKAVWVFGLFLAGVLTYAYVDVYLDRQRSDTKALVAADSTKAQATAENAQQLREVKAQQQTVIAAVTSISAATGTIIANQTKNMAILTTGQKEVKQAVKSQAKEVKKTLQSSVIQARPLEPKKPEPEEKEKKSLMDRFKGLFHTSARYDTLVTANRDTLVFQ